MSGRSNPHDAVFRRVLGEPANAASQLRAVLPAAVVDRLDLDRLAPVPGSFVDEDLQWRHSDVLFSVPLDGHDAFVYILIEHQSSTDALMPFRMLRYMVRIWDRYLAQHSEVTRLPAVVPVVVHHNRRPWSGPTDVVDVIDLDDGTAEAVREFLPRFRFLLDDLARVDVQVLRERPLTAYTRLTLLLLKIAPGNDRLGDDLKAWAEDIHAVLQRSDGIDALITLLTYIEHVGETPTDELHQLFTQLGPDAEEAYVTTAEMLRAEGRAEGEARGEARAILEFLAARGVDVPDHARAHITACTDHDQLRTWIRRAATATTIDDLFR